MKKIVSLISTGAILAFGLVSVASPLASALDEVAIGSKFYQTGWPSSPEYAEAVANAYGKTSTDIIDLDTFDFETITGLDANGTMPGSAENFTSWPVGTYRYGANLLTVNMANNNIQDVSWVGDMPLLQKLDLGNNFIDDISFLSSLTNLEWLNLEGNEWCYFQDDDSFFPAEGVIPFEGGCKIEYDIHGLNDISVLEGLMNLKYVNLSHTQTGDQQGTIKILTDRCVTVILADGTVAPLPSACTYGADEPGLEAPVTGVGDTNNFNLVMMAVFGVAAALSFSLFWTVRKKRD